MPLYDIYNTCKIPDGILAGQPRQTRQEVMAAIEREQRSDLLIIGGGVHGATFAHLAAFNGLKTVLLEKGDYGGASSGAPLYMLAGWPQRWRFHTLCDLGGFRAKLDLLNTAAHLVRVVDVQAFGSPAFGCRANFILHLQRWLGVRNGLRHGRLPRDQRPGVFYQDGLVNGPRLVIDQITAARQEGAQCLNYARVDSFQKLTEGGLQVGWSDLIKGGKHELKCGMIINCAGGWVPQIGRIRPGNMAGRLKHRRMLYALFDRPWEAPARFVLAPKRCYLVAPYCGVVFVALMLEETAGPVGPGPASAQDLADLLRMLAHDMPEAGLEATRLYSAWQGSETVSVDVSTRKDLVSSGARCWSYENGMLNLLGGDYGSVSWTVYQGLKQVYRLSGVRDRIVPLNGRLLPGAGLFQESAVEFRRAAAENKVPAQVTERILACLGSRARLISGFDQGWQILPGNLLRGEVELAFELEQAESLEDVVRRRLQVAFLADYDRSVLEGVLKVGSPQRPHLSLKDANYLREIDLSKEKTTAL